MIYPKEERQAGNLSPQKTQKQGDSCSVVLGSSDPMSVCEAVPRAWLPCEESAWFPDFQVQRNMRLREMSKDQKVCQELSVGRGSHGTGRTGQLGLKSGTWGGY